MKLLIVIPDLPYPPRENGLNLRYYPILKSLSTRHEIDMFTIFPRQLKERNIEEVRTHCHRLRIEPQKYDKKPSIYRKLMMRARRLFSGTTPIRHLNLYSKRHLKALAEFTQNKEYDCVFWITIAYGEYIFKAKKMISAKRWVIDLVDSYALHIKRRESTRTLYKSTLAWERRCIKMFDAAIYISKVDAATVRINDKDLVPTYVIPNGIYIEDYLETIDQNIPSLSIGFLGNMEYLPNIEAVEYLHNKIFKPLKQKIPELQLYIVGRNPAQSILDLAKDKSVHITGEVESVWPYLNSVGVFVLPLKSGAGQQNKILEIMYSGRPIVTSEMGNGGIQAEHNKELILCGESDEEWIDSTEKLLSNKSQANRIGLRGRKFLLETYIWDGIIQKLEQLLSGNTINAGKN